MILIESKHTFSSLLAENIPLEDGIYEGYFYSWILEINDITYKTLYGVRCTKKYCKGLQSITIKDNCAYL